MGSTYSTYREKRNTSRILDVMARGRRRLGDIAIGGKIILRWIVDRMG
jgi:hypothetical protein